MDTATSAREDRSQPLIAAPMTTPWGANPFAPLNVAAFITWLAVGVQSLQWQALASADPEQWAGVVAFLVVAAAYVLSNRLNDDDERDRSLQRKLVIVQAIGTLFAAWVMSSGGPAVLLIIVAAQAVALWPRRQAIIGMGICNLLLVLAWLGSTSLANALIALLPMIGFQIFAALTTHYATSAEHARAELSATHAQLLSTQQLLEESARSGERLRLSRELHDVAGHKLTALKLNLRLLQRDSALAEREEVRVAAVLADELLADIRAVVSELRKDDGIDLARAIQALTAQMPGVEFVVNIDPETRVDSIESAQILLRCAQEGITNALRHARPTRIEITVQERQGQIELIVRNDGAPLKETRFGNGLTGMAERLHAAGGELTLHTLGDGAGTELIAALPAHG